MHRAWLCSTRRVITLPFQVAQSPPCCCSTPAGVYHAWHALAIQRHALPAATARQLGAALAPPPPAAAAAAASAASTLCGPTIRVHCTLLPGEPEQHGQLAVDLQTLAARHLQPALSQLAPARVGSNVLLYPPRLPAQQLRWDEQRQAHVLAAAAAASWAQRMQQLAWSAVQAHADSSLELAAAAVLLYVPPPAHLPLLLELGGGDASASMQLPDSSLLLIVNHNGSGDSSGNGSCGSITGPHASQEEQLAGAILSWLLQPLAASSGGGSGATSSPDTLQQLRRSLTAACAAEAAVALQRFVGAAEAAPDQPVTAAMASRAAEVVQLLKAVAAQQQEEQAAEAGQGAATQGLAAARGAWAAAHQLLHDPGTGASQAFPPEHTLAVLLPLALPVSLVLVQAAGREAAAWRKRRAAEQAAAEAHGKAD